MRKDFLVFGNPTIEDEEIAGVEKTLRSGWLGTGPKVEKFENAFKQYKAATYAIALNSCTAALHLSMLTLSLRPGDEVITTAMTFCSTVNAIIHSGATPVLVDCNMDTMNIDPAEIEKKITPRTKVILPVHFAGRPCDMDRIMALAKKYNLKVIEDCAHSVEAEYHNAKLGTIGDLGCFSFYVTKNIVTGEGGMVVTDNKEFSDKIKILGLHGMTKDAWSRYNDKGYKHYYVVYPGYKYNMMDIQAAIGICQLNRVEKYLKKRKAIWSQYNEAFYDLPVGVPKPPEPGTKHAMHLYTIMIDKEKLGFSRDHFLNLMTQNNIGVGVHYQSIAEHPYYQKALGIKPSDFPNANYIGDCTVSLPLSPKLNEKDVEDVIDSVKKIVLS